VIQLQKQINHSEQYAEHGLEFATKKNNLKIWCPSVVQMKEKRQWCKGIAGNFRVQGGDHEGVTKEETLFHEFSTTDYSHYLNIVFGGRAYQCAAA
jgi:hypothetical protein